MRRTLGTIALLLTLTIGGIGAAASTSSSTPPPGPGPVQPSSIAGCWKWTLESHVEKRFVTIEGHRFAQFRTVATALRWCPKSGYVVVTWRSPWGPGRR